MKKKGTHIGIVISFMVFITFLFFLYSIVQPAIEISNEKQIPLDSLEREVLLEVSASLTTASVAVDKSFGNPCVQLNGAINETVTSTNLIVINESGYVFNTLFSVSGTTYDLFINRPNGMQDSFFKIRSSEEFSKISGGTMAGCGIMNKGAGGYTVGLVKTKEHVFSSRIENLIAVYNADYSTARSLLKVSSNDDFGLSFTYANGTVIRTKEINISSSVYAKDIPVQYIDGANEVSGIMNIEIW